MTVCVVTRLNSFKQKRGFMKHITHTKTHTSISAQLHHIIKQTPLRSGNRELMTPDVPPGLFLDPPSFKGNNLCLPKQQTLVLPASKLINRIILDALSELRQVCAHQFIQQLFTEYLLCVRFPTRCPGHSSEQTPLWSCHMEIPFQQCPPEWSTRPH